ncbi:hypothetical protein BH09PAT3_BH09PAT3_0290 [soil metagenome]
MKITIFGASGKVGRLVVDKLLQQGHTVTVFVHQSSVFEPSEQLKIIKSDVHNAAFVEAAVRGSDAVVSTLGSWHTPTKDILSAAMSYVIPAMQKEGIKRIITLTGSAAWAPGDTISFGNKLSHKVFSFIAKDIIRDSETHLILLADSGLDWTSIRSPIMRKGASRGYTLNSDMPGATETIERDAVAQAIVDQLTATDQLTKAPQIHRS